jgi:competence protein ComEA
MHNFIKSYFYFSRSEKYGILLFIIIIMAIFFIPAYLNYRGKPAQVNFTQYGKEIRAFEAALQTDTIQNFNRNFVPDFERVEGSITENKLHPFAFDPNVLGGEQLMVLGLSEKQVKTILNYRNKGGRFYRKEDLKKIYGISENEYRILEPYISINIPGNTKGTKALYAGDGKPFQYWKTIIDVNTADSVDLLEIKGVGPTFAHRILRYRNKLGGFFEKEQLLEVFGMDSVRFAKIADFCTVGNSAVRKINMNTATVSDFKKHPYFDYYLAKSIVDYRIIHGPYAKVEQLKYTPLIYEDLYKKIAPYLTVE